jgi:hypothetical protein
MVTPLRLIRYIERALRQTSGNAFSPTVNTLVQLQALEN